MKRRAGLQSLDVSACTGIQEEGFRAIASLTQLTALDASCLADRKETAAALLPAVSMLSSLTGEECIPICLSYGNLTPDTEHTSTH